MIKDSLMGWFIIIIIIIVVVVNSNSSKKKNYHVNTKIYPNNVTYETQRDPNNLWYRTLSKLNDEYLKVSSKCPPLNSLVRRAYEHGHITSGRRSFEELDEKDKKTVLRIAISIERKRNNEKSDSSAYERKKRMDVVRTPISTLNYIGYDRDGYDRDGYDRDGYDRDGYDRDGYNRQGHKRGSKELSSDYFIRSKS